MRLIHFILILFIFCCNNAISQQVIIDNTISVSDLIENNLADGCVEISNPSSSINGSADGFPSFGAFQRADSDFPLSKGIVISTGNAASGGNNENGADLSEGTLSWRTDPDIETFLGVSNTVNATSIEFDFVALSDLVQFNYIMASEEYFADYPCNSSDGFVFLIKESTSSGPYTNIALVPGTSTPVTINNIHDEILSRCSAINDQYFDGLYKGDTNYNGRTQILTAATNVIPNVQYHVKLIVADQGGNTPDPDFDTAIFIEASTFTELELGEDISTCSDNVTLNGEIQNPLATYAWLRDGTIIAGETNPTLNTTITGLYKVEISINGLTCVLEDEIFVTIDTELTTNPIVPYELCDPDGDNEEVFDLSNKNSDVIDAIQSLPVNYSLSYYLTDADARSNSNNITSPITSPSRTIYVKVEDLDTGCLIYGNFDLIVNTLPSIIQPSDIDTCDNDDTPDGSTVIDLTQKDSEITAGQSNLIVTYHYSQIDANSGNNPIQPPYTNTNPSETLYIRVVNTITECVNSTDATLTVNVTNGNTGIVRDIQFIDACDKESAYAYFDLTERLSDILNGETGFLPPTYHTNPDDAQTGANPIPNPSNFQNTEPNQQTIYVRLVDSTTGCFAIVPIEIHTNLLLTGTLIEDFALCDDESNSGIPNDGSGNFDLIFIENLIINDIPNTSITFYESISDRDNDNPIDSSVYYTANSGKILYIQLDNGTCIEEAEITLRINPVLLFEQIDPEPYCDTDDDGVASVDLHSFDDMVTNGNTDFVVSYFADPNDAELNFQELPPFYVASGIKTIYARIENIGTGCRTINSFQIEIVPAPSVLQPNDILICDNDQDGLSIINLENKISEIRIDPTNIINFFRTFDDANNNTNPISNLTSFNASTQTIYTRVQSSSGIGCFSIVDFNIIINTIPIIPTITPFQLCIDENETVADFIFADKDAQILNDPTNKDVFYFEDPSFTTPIDKNIPYTSSGEETIYVRVENITDPTCYSTSSFTIEVGSNPNYNTNFTDFPPVCQSSAGSHTFDLEAKRQEIMQGSTDVLNVNFYLTPEEARNNANSFLPAQYTSEALQGQFYARIENTANSCYIIEEVRFLTFSTPIITVASIDPVCDTDYDGNATIDLTATNYQIENIRFSEATISYFEDSELTIEIPSANLSNYPVSNTKLIYIKAENSSTLCSASAPLELIVNLPPVFNSISTIEVCDNDTNTYDLSQLDSVIVDDPNNVNLSYHSNINDAENNLNPLPNTFNYTGNFYTFFVRIEDLNTGCIIIPSFNLQINPNPVAFQPSNLNDCDDDYDGFLVFDLSQQKDAIIGPENPTNFEVTYYTSLIDALNKENVLNNAHASFDGEIIYARMENNITGCFDTTSFSTIVHPLPVINIRDIVPLCLNDIPLIIDASTGFSGDTYLWSTGETTSQIELMPEDLGDYWITITTPNNCQATKSFSVIESEEANINFTTTVDFADPNSITVDVSGIGTYVYILDDGEPQISNVFENVTFGPHIVTVRDVNGCKDVSKEVVVIDVPKFVTPNNDGYFDTWHIVGIEQLPGTIVYIYDRHGKLIKTLPSSSPGWDGTYRGKNMPSDDYWFVAKVKKDGIDFDYKGHFALKR